MILVNTLYTVSINTNQRDRERERERDFSWRTLCAMTLANNTKWVSI